MICRYAVAIAALLIGTVTVYACGFGKSCVPAIPGGIYVSGNTLKVNGVTTVLHGTVREGTEYTCVPNNLGIFDTTLNAQNDDIEVPFMRSWGVNTTPTNNFNALTLGLNEDCWLNINMGTSIYGGQVYISAIEHEVQTLERNGIHPVLSLIYSAAGATQAASQATMPDNDHTPAFWRSVAMTFKNDPKVIFRIKEEFFPASNTDTVAAWTCWSKGDVQYGTNNTLVPISTTSNCSETFTTVGAQSLVNIIRGAGAKNIIALSGIQFASSLTHFLDAGIAVVDPMTPPNLMASIDVYTVSDSCTTTSCFNTKYASVAAVMPLWVGEIGEDTAGANAPSTMNTLMTWLDTTCGGCGYSTWAWNINGSGNLAMISSYGTGIAKSLGGTNYKTHLATLQ
jgi:hypothetical protein